MHIDDDGFEDGMTLEQEIEGLPGFTIYSPTEDGAVFTEEDIRFLSDFQRRFRGED